MKFYRCFAVFVVFVGFGGSFAEARVFDINKETVSAYFGITEGPSVVGSSAFENEAGKNITYTSSVTYNYSGEFGFLYSHPLVSARFGLEFLKPQQMQNLMGRNGTTDLYSQTSDLTGYNPKVTLEFNLRKDNVSRFFFSAGLGYATVILTNSYSLTSAGNTAYPGMDTSMSAKGSATSWSGSLGQELLMSDTTTFLFEIGYRYLKINNLQYTSAGNYFGTAHAAGDIVMNNGNSRALDFTGAYVGISFRFYM